MKTLLVTVSFALAGMGSAQAQVFRPSVGNSAVVGAIAGSLIGGHNGDRWAQGAVIGGVAGALIGAALTAEPVYQSPPPVYYQTPASYGQLVYGQSGTTIPYAPTVANAPFVPAAPMLGESVPTQVVQAPPQIVYVESAPRVVYVPAPGPRVIYAAPPPYVNFGFGYYSGPRYHGYSGRVYRGGSGHRR
ncbi:MAG: hypothetical protein EXS37_00165 [Opitutus sp.]|nr:hypothetical protein [Opitutus sp.]